MKLPRLSTVAPIFFGLVDLVRRHRRDATPAEVARWGRVTARGVATAIAAGGIDTHAAAMAAWRNGLRSLATARDVRLPGDLVDEAAAAAAVVLIAAGESALVAELERLRARAAQLTRTLEAL